MDIDNNLVSEDEAYTRVFEKEHPRRVRSMGLGVCPTQIFGPAYHYRGSTSSSSIGTTTNAKIIQLMVQLEASNERVKLLEEQMSFILQN